jgi:ABC-type polysaccharide/polyol phosphate transport system ATPase subunit
MNNVIIKAEGISKQYHIRGPQQQFDTFGSQLLHTLKTPIKRTKNLLRGQITAAADTDTIHWALRDVSFEVKQGEVIGIVGRNGAGKSTLLKILSQITEPTSGTVRIHGRIASLLEVGTGFHPELTGRENVFLNGAILGMKKVEIKRHFDEIVAFAELEKFIDTPVKHYSSGRYVRLAFAVAAHLEPEILLVDEVLAVGDVAFQKKCMGKMDEVTKAGRTILFVSHNMNAVLRLCPHSILLKDGQLVTYEDTPSVVEKYLASGSGVALPEQWVDVSTRSSHTDARVQIKGIAFTSDTASVQNFPYAGGPLNIKVRLDSDAARTLGSLAVTVYDQYGTKLVNVDTAALNRVIDLHAGHNEINLNIKALHLNPGVYVMGVWAANPPGEVFDENQSAFRFEVTEKESNKMRVQDDGVVTCDFSFENKELEVFV